MKNLTDLLVFAAGWYLCWKMFWFLDMIGKSKHHGATKVGITCPTLLAIIGLFAISTPKVSNLVLEFGRNKLKVSQLEKDVSQKATELAQLQVQLTPTPNLEESHLQKHLSVASSSPEFITKIGDAYFLSLSKAKSITPDIDWKKYTIGNPDKQWIVIRQVLTRVPLDTQTMVETPVMTAIDTQKRKTAAIPVEPETGRKIFMKITEDKAEIKDLSGNFKAPDPAN